MIISFLSDCDFCKCLFPIEFWLFPFLQMTNGLCLFITLYVYVPIESNNMSSPSVINKLAQKGLLQFIFLKDGPFDQAQYFYILVNLKEVLGV